MILYVNKFRLRESRFREGNLVYLLRRNIKTIRLSNKLDLKKIGLFKVKRNIRDISFEFKLSLIMRIHPIFYISLLESAYSDIPEKSVPELDPEI
jgi:hypothetical protein